jgi:hypothetical protein
MKPDRLADGAGASAATAGTIDPSAASTVAATPARNDLRRPRIDARIALPLRTLPGAKLNRVSRTLTNS